MTRDLLLALDLGTTSVRALLVDPELGVRARAARPLPTRFPAPGRVEQDAAEMAERSEAVLREALAGGGASAHDVAGLGVATQRGTALAWEAETLRPLAPAIGWQDRRTAARCAALARQGIPMSTLAAATKLEWQLHDVEAVERAARAGALRMGGPDAWLTARLTGGEAFVTDPGQAVCTGLCSLASLAWADGLLGMLDLDAAWLPRIVPTSSVVGSTPAALLGAPVPVAARAGDQQAAAFAQGVHARGDAKLTLGTSAMLDLHTGERPSRARDGAYPLPLWELADGARAFCLEGTVVAAGAAVDWAVGLGLLDAPAGLDRACEGAADTGGVVFVPALQGLGTPLLDDRARGLLGGLTRGSSRAQVLRAVVEGIAHRCVDVVEAMGLEEGPLRVDGALARSGVLLQALADLSGREVLRAAELETTALGAALLAGLSSGVFTGTGDVRARLAEPVRVKPLRLPDWRASARHAWRRALARARS